MTLNELIEILEERDEYLKFENVKEKLSSRPDLHAFLLVDKLAPVDSDIIGSAVHDEIYLNVDVEELAKVITKEQAVDLLRCGVIYNKKYDCLMMFT